MTTNCFLRLILVPSVNNLADRSSRSLSLADSRLSVSFWKRLQDAFGGPNGHSVDLMALLSHALLDWCNAAVLFSTP